MSSPGRFLVLFGTQTGQAKAIAEIIRDKALERGLQPELFCFSYSEKKFDLEKEPVVVIVVSTTGDGEPPETVRKVWRKLRRKTLSGDHLSNLHFALLGLGDTNYDNFCNMGKMLNERLLELGAQSFYPPGFADDAVGLEAVVEPWIEQLWTPLKEILSASSTPPTNSKPSERVDTSTESNGEKQKDSLETSSISKSDSSTEAAGVGKAGSRMNSGDGTTTTKAESKKNPFDMYLSTSKTSSKKTSTESSTANGRTIDSKATSKHSTTQTKRSPLPPTKRASDSVLRQASKLSTEPSKESKALSSVVCSLAKELAKVSLDSASLTLTAVPPAFLDVHVKRPQASTEFPFNKVPYRIRSSVSMATIVGARPLTNEGSVKRTLEMEINLEGDVSYEPGDALGFVCPNPPKEVQWLLQRLKLTSKLRQEITVSLLSYTTKRNPVLPSHVPRPCTVQQLFTYSVDIRCVPKKAFLCLLSNYCSNKDEAKRLKELSSRQGAKQYTHLFTEHHTDFLDVLNYFPSCQPPLDRLVENLPRLHPRYYSATSSPLYNPRKVKIAFNVESLPPREWGGDALGPVRKGLATGWFAYIADTKLPDITVKVPIFTRSQNPFQLPDVPKRPIIMIGPGTGVSPFIGFLLHLSRQREEVGGANIRKAWLFFGCRHPDLDYLYKQEIEHFHSSGILTQLSVSHSRYPPRTDSSTDEPPRYVQDCMKQQWKELGKWIMEEDAVVYVCGDAFTMLRDTQEAMKLVIAKYKREKPFGTGPLFAMSPSDVLAKMKEDKRFLVDMWA